MLIILPIAVGVVGYVLWFIMYAFRSPEYDRAHRQNPALYPGASDMGIGCGCAIGALIIVASLALLR